MYTWYFVQDNCDVIPIEFEPKHLFLYEPICVDEIDGYIFLNGEGQPIYMYAKSGIDFI
jgi:hypothetical protein